MKESCERQIKLSVLLRAHTQTSVYLFGSFKKDTSHLYEPPSQGGWGDWEGVF